jgi:hypothetical protein
MGQGRGWVVLGGHAEVKATRVGLCAHIGPSRVANDAHKPPTWEHHPEIGAAVQGPAHGFPRPTMPCAFGGSKWCKFAVASRQG